MEPVPGTMVTLHRVGSDSAAPLDSTRTDRSGRYVFTYRRSGDADAIYFVSASHGGIAYFTAPLAAAAVRGEAAEIAVFDTTSGPVEVHVRGRHIIVSAVDAGSRRSITEVYEIANDSSVTVVARGNQHGDAVWSTIVPAGASDFQVGNGDVPPAGVTFGEGRLSLFSPIAPGIKQVVFSYFLPASAFPLSVPVVEPTQVLEVLLEEERGSVNGARLSEVEPVSGERRTFRRFLASDVPVNAVAVIDLPPQLRGRVDSRYILLLGVLMGGAMLAVLARALRRR